jgi:hypothetical protein
VTAEPAERATETPAPPRMRHVRPLGAGGMGVVFLADRALGDGLTQRVVVKRPRADDELGPRARQRFADEARVLARLSHGNIVRLLDAGADAHGPWIALEHVDGVDAHVLLASLRASGERLAVDELAHLVHGAARGMSAAHGLRDEAGAPDPVLHRDLSPQNLLLSRRGEVRVTDFGIAWAVARSVRTTTGVVVGNLRYIAPEQLEGRPVGPTTDVYGLGRVLEELLDVTAGADEGLRAVAARATRRAPDERFATMDALAEALLAAVPTLARGEAALGRRVEAVQGSSLRVTSALAGLLAAERGDATGTAELTALPAVSPPGAESPAAAPPPALPAVSPPRAGSPDPTTSRGPSRPPARPPRPRGALVAGVAAAVAAGVLAIAPRPRGGASSHPPAREAPRPSAPSERAPRPAPEPSPEPAPEPARAESAPVGSPAPAPPTPARPALRRGAREAPRAPAAPAAATAPTADAAVTPPPRGTLRVSALPRAMVSVDDGEMVWAPHDFSLAPGDHRVRARFVGSGDAEVTRAVTLRAHEELRLGLTP